MKNFRCFTAILLIATMFISFNACSSDEDDKETELILSSESELLFKNGINFTFEKGEQTISFFTNKDWNISIAKPTNEEVWCTVSLTSGKAGNQTVKVNVTENESSDSRSVSLTIKAGNIEKNVLITQNGRNENDDITVHFDSDFAKILQNKGYIPNCIEIKRSDVNKKTFLDVGSSNISSMAGIEYFEALTLLYCNDNQLRTLDISKNTKLENFYCDNNQLTSLDVSKNTELTYLYCYNNQLTSLDVSKNTELTYLYCHSNQLTSLNVNKNTTLIKLLCDNNELTNLDVSKNTRLVELACNYNELTSLDVSKNTELTYLSCYYNQLRTLDISKNTKLENFYCDNNPGDGTKFIVKAWFINANIPLFFTTAGWYWNFHPINIEYQKAN